LPGPFPSGKIVLAFRSVGPEGYKGSALHFSQILDRTQFLALKDRAFTWCPRTG
jgi:hypothetical protein